MEGRLDGQTEMTKLIVVFHNFANSPKNCDTFWKRSDHQTVEC